MLKAPNLSHFDWLRHGFGLRDSEFPLPITTVKQIHSCTVIEIPGDDRASEGDALISCTAGVTVGVRTADCVPILIADERTHAIACIHAGWRGTAGAIGIAAIQEIIARFGARPQDLHAAI